MDRISLSRDELLEALRQVYAREPSPDDAYTAKELLKLTGWSVGRMGKALELLLGNGTWECIRVTRTIRDGRQHPIPAYRPKKHESP